MRKSVHAAWELLPLSATSLLPTLAVITAIGLAAVLITAAVTFTAAGNPSVGVSEPPR